jgi:hypothetical protein
MSHMKTAFEEVIKAVETTGFDEGYNGDPKRNGASAWELAYELAEPAFAPVLAFPYIGMEVSCAEVSEAYNRGYQAAVTERGRKVAA